jgi:hypothetical protein
MSKFDDESRRPLEMDVFDIISTDNRKEWRLDDEISRISGAV